MTQFKRKAIGEKPRIVETAPELAPGPAPGNKPTTKRETQKALTHYLDDPAVYQWKMLVAELRMTSTDAMREAMNDFFVKHGKPPIA